ncbi:MAG: RNA polymerase factor sigma-54, partial [Polaromonas sp.]
MKQGLSLRVSQHLALTPQLQQSIRLLQLSTLELSQEVEQMLDENPFLELAEEAAVREEFGLEHTNTPVSQDNREFESATDSIAVGADEPGATSQNDAEISPEPRLEDSWDGDGTVESAPNDSEWGGDAQARKNNLDDSEAEASDLVGSHESLQDHLHRQSLGLRLSEED